MPNSWCWLASKGASRGEGADAASPQKVRGEVSGPEALLRLSRRWPYAGAHSRRALEVSQSFGDDALAYFTARLDAAVTRRAAVTAVRQAKRHKAFDDSRFITAFVTCIAAPTLCARPSTCSRFSN